MTTNIWKNAVEQNEDILIINEVILGQWDMSQYINSALCIVFIYKIFFPEHMFNDTWQSFN